MWNYPKLHWNIRLLVFLGENKWSNTNETTCICNFKKNAYNFISMEENLYKNENALPILTVFH